MSHRTNTLRIARGEPARPFTGTALDVTLRACDRNVPDPVYRLAERAWLRNIYESNGAGIDAGMNREPKRESGDPLPIYPYGKELGMQ